ncbi:hypothetical protein SERLA73DRAFT_115908 [Serpula lacrymans var. lacrymans S7.3]|uniref:MYND-type domain-containing protein n=2 Tax=Serpula lacrymans var. lacrymans TaxID=341189 RepID=F8QEB9_SERL3|nr:uncharacterized protein SERLADRAFT_454099 [Serpula lacrymans var. lacrymans S7.9]EGN93494.1 hypothetical protein SERLA73DRAFT_115908 [Serpula lacrymans var. lacrymans S7.3]EGO18873.1 hypothetical protein SERLADRAFT_454099 [Serpula lacrymans var. lacrymans S7.9]
MSHPCLWPGKTFFYPIGNTTAVCLTQDLAPEENANVLLLGCGDPRNILYTLYASEADSASFSRSLDFTCCDVEGAVLARNVLLLSLLANGGALERVDQIWDIFYHFYLDDSTSSLLVDQSQKLVKLSKDLSTWESSEYGTFLRMCTDRTLSDLRGYWSSYASTGTFTHEKQIRMRKAFSESIRSAGDGTLLGGGYNFTGGRSAGPMSAYILRVVADQFRRYWKTGTTSSDAESLTHVNPTFVYSSKGDRFLVHYGTDPLLSFHLAEAYTNMRDTPKPTESVTVEDVVSVARAQFRRWCTSFVNVLRAGDPRPLVTVRFFVGDALSFCRALRCCNITRTTVTPIYNAPWSVSRLELNDNDYGANALSPAPTEFNVIETSNIMDHVGLLNVLIAASPLLIPSTSSTLLTEALLSSGNDPFTGILKRVCADLPTLSLLIGLIPSTFISRFTTQSNMHEILSAHVSQSPQFHERLSWKSAAGGDTIAAQCDIDISRATTFSPEQLAKILFDIYLKMFSEENVNILFQLAVSENKINNIIHYNRRTFAELVAVIKERIHMDWTQVMEMFHDLVARDHTLVTGLNYYQDLCCQLHLLGVYSADTLRVEGDFLSPQKVKQSAIFRGWKSVPPSVCIVLEVPSSSLAPIATALDKTGTPMLHCEIRGSTFQNAFSCIQATYGAVAVSGSGEDRRIVITEDHAGGTTAPLVVSFWAPSWILMLESTIRVGFGVRPTPASTVSLTQKLGLDLMIYTTKVTDDQHVHVVTERPNLDGEVTKEAAVLNKAKSRCSRSPHRVAVTMDRACSEIENLTVRIDITDPAAQSALSKGSGVTVEQVTPCAVQVCIENYNHVISFPLPVNAGKSKVRVARKSKYVEVVAPLSPADVTNRLELPTGKFPVIVHGRIPTLWNIHRVNLDRLPVVNTKDPAKLQWIVGHTTLMLSDREKKAQGEAVTNDKVPQDVLVNLKESLYAIFTASTGVQQPKTCAFGLSDPDSVGVYTLIFVTDVRLDLGCHTIVADAWVLPLTIDIMSDISRAVRVIMGDLTQIRTDADEMRAWKQLLPALTERCRTWRHKDSCEYLAKGTIPLSKEYGESPICTCGRGVGTAALRKVKGWKDFAPFVTRIALSPIFAVSYLESIGNFSENLNSEEAQSRESRLKDAGGSTQQNSVCAACEKEGKPKLLLCSKCRKVSYCSVECQRREWKKHKPQCAVLKEY